MSDTTRALNSMLKTLQDRAEAFHQAECITPLLTIVNGHATATSLDIARHFDKLHKNVLRDIKAHHPRRVHAAGDGLHG